jgi:type IV secretory pathway TrbL component
MSIETLLQDLTAAVQANTAALQGKAHATAGKAETKATTGKTDKAASANKSKISKAEMQAALNKVKEEKGTAAAKKLIANAGFDKLAEVSEDKYQELYDAAKAELGEGGDDDTGSDDGL